MPAELDVLLVVQVFINIFLDVVNYAVHSYENRDTSAKNSLLLI
jgi:hypothetical protein